MRKIVLVEFQVTVKDIRDFSQYQASDYVAEKLAVSLMLSELGVNNIKIGGHEFNLQVRRDRTRRILRDVEK